MPRSFQQSNRFFQTTALLDKLQRSDISSDTEGALGVASRKRLFIIAYNAYFPLEMSL